MKICEICKKSFGTLGGLHLHLKKTEGTSQEEYYHRFFPRFDINNGKIIPYKTHADYFSRLFIDKKSEFSYILSEGFQDDAKDILEEQLGNALTKCDRFPSYVEWRSSKNIRYDWLEKKGILQPLLDSKPDTKKLRYDDPCEIHNLDHEILIDTREQKPFFEGERSSVNVGDYCFGGRSYNGVNIDRKSKNDFIGTFGPSGIDRFIRECEKAKALDVQLVVLVEESYQSCWSYTPMRFSKAKITGQKVFHGVRRVFREYGVQFVFAKDLNHAKKLARLILSNPDLVKGWDLQFLVEKGII